MVRVRFLLLGVQPFLIASTRQMTLSQCLVKMVRPDCGELGAFDHGTSLELFLISLLAMAS